MKLLNLFSLIFIYLFSINICCTKFTTTLTSHEKTLSTAVKTTTTKYPRINPETNQNTTATKKPKVIGVCDMNFGFNISKGVLICNRDSYGSTRNASEVNG